MPYKTADDVPERIKKGMTPKGVSIFRAAFNAALEKYNSEERAFKIAHAAVTKAGERKGEKESMGFSDTVRHLLE